MDYTNNMDPDDLDSRHQEEQNEDFLDNMHKNDIDQDPETESSGVESEDAAYPEEDSADALSGGDLPEDEAAVSDLLELPENSLSQTEILELLSGIQETAALLQEQSDLYHQENLSWLDALQSSSMLIVLVMILTFARACVSSARSYLEKSWKAVK